jgi:3-oxoacyl-[acyl-carrier protein] reductase
MELDLSGKAAIVTGGSLGIGRAITLELAGEGVDVLCVARRQENLDETARAAQGLPGKVRTISMDCTADDAAPTVIDKAIDEFGRLDILVNNVGYGWLGHDWQIDDATWEHTIELNLYTAVRFSRAAVPHLRAAGDGSGRIINMSSVSGHSGLPAMVDYNAAKAGLIMWAKTISRELAPDITVHSVCPGFIDTPLWEDLAGQLQGEVGETVKDVYAAMADANVPLKRYGTAAEVAGLVTFLASSRSGFMTGGTFNVDGGYTTFAFS